MTNKNYENYYHLEFAGRILPLILQKVNTLQSLTFSKLFLHFKKYF